MNKRRLSDSTCIHIILVQIERKKIHIRVNYLQFNKNHKP